MYIADELLHTIGDTVQLQALFEIADHGVVFEDDGETGYFYAVDTDGVLDALHIYDVADIDNRDIPFDIKILADEPLSLFALSINDVIHALFDFDKKSGKCRNAFPEAYGEWVQDTHRELTDENLEEYFGKMEK